MARCVLFAAFAAVSLLLTGCQTGPPLQPVNLSEPGWTTREGQAIWKRGPGAPEIAGEILVATRPDGRAFVQFSKNPFPLVIAQSTPDRWQVETPTNGKRYSGHGKPPARLIFLHLARALTGQPLSQKWLWQKLEPGGWRLENRGNGEWIEVHFTQ